MASTGPSHDTRQAVITRACYRCERCDGPLDTMSVHHRRPRGMGGTRDETANWPENLLALCGTGTTGCHGWVESNRTAAYDTGLLLRRGLHPHETPFQDLKGRWWFLRHTVKHHITLPSPS